MFVLVSQCVSSSLHVNSIKFLYELLSNGFADKICSRIRMPPQMHFYCSYDFSGFIFVGLLRSDTVVNTVANVY
uniref:AlNc14C29G2754 protein n=1 Tax=Albugo laibachii Nc14 TaxID=890382 RepID=F0W7D9_9STRA|nr:AlNc14C29G2754 [Albugo laibachii Nc14]|eukprot:CCA17038.1 AlNc14C29G2754 [Albugo laibachii Nc14]